MSNVPKLRFKDFNEDWKLTRLDQLIELQSGYAFKSEYFTDTQGRKLVIPKNFTKNGFGNFEQSLCKFTSEGYDNKYVCKANDLLILLTDLTPSCELLGKPLMVRPVDGELLLNQRIARVVNKGTVNTEYLKNYFLTGPFSSRIKNTATGSTVRHTSNKIILETETIMPSPLEQQKIAAFLTAVDTKIEQLTQKEALLKQYKKGVMQKIFSQEIRFKADDGSEFPEWSEVKLGEIGNITIGEFVIKSKQNPLSPYPVYNGGRSNTGYYDEFNNKGNKIIISARGANAGFVNFEPRDYWAGNSCYSISMKDTDSFSIRFYYYFIKHYENLFTDFQQAANIPSVNKKDVELFKVVRLHLREQEKIVQFFDRLDQKLALLSRELGSAIAFKKGLLQQMFV